MDDFQLIARLIEEGTEGVEVANLTNWNRITSCYLGAVSMYIYIEIGRYTHIKRSKSIQMIRGDEIEHRERDDRKGGEKQKQAPNDATFGPVESFHLEQ